MSVVDKEAGAILEALRTVTPEVAEQAVSYWRFANSVGIGVCFLIIAACTILFFCFRKKYKQAKYYDSTDYGMGMAISAVVGCIVFLFLSWCTLSLVQSFIAPDYYAADCIVDLGQSAFGH